VIADNEPQETRPELTVMGNLPPQLTRLIGREAALTELRAEVWGARLLTLCGPGGAGKTRLAVALADAMQADFVGGAWWVDLSETSGSALVAQAVAATVLPGEGANDPTPAAISRRFAESSLLVLDNCEQVAEACAELTAALLARCQGLRIVATSRQPLGVSGEHVWRVQGLDVASPAAGDPGAEQGGAVELFLERAREADSAFAQGDAGTLALVEEICSWLDGIPLAIELAAARVPILGVAHLAQRLQRGSGFLRHSSRSAPARHQTLRAMLDWSHRLLEPSEQHLFAMLGSFRGSFGLDAVEAVCADDLFAPDEVLDLLGVLVDRSLVQVVDRFDQPRYKLLATVRHYAIERLQGAGSHDPTRERHARFYLAFAQAANRGLSGTGQVEWLGRVSLEHDNLREATRWLLDRAPTDAAALASLLWPFWYGHGYYAEARLWFEQALAASHELPRAVLLELLTNAGEVAFLQCDYGQAIDHLERGLGVAEELADKRGAATILQRLGSIAREQGDYPQARELHERSLAIWVQFADAYGIAASQNYLGFVAWLDGDPAGAQVLCEGATQVFKRSANLREAALALVNLGACALYLGDPELAAVRLEEALAISRKLGFQEGIAWSEHELAIAGRQRRTPLRDNAVLLTDALLIQQQLGDRWRMASVLEEIAGALLMRQEPRQAVSTLAAAETLRGQLGTPVPPAEAPDRRAALNRLRGKLSPAAFEAAWTEGQAREPDQAVDAALAAIDLLGRLADGGRPRTAAPVLTPRELAVLELLSEGLTNREIAAALYISPSTAGVHVSNILRKLGANRRVDAAGLAHRLGLLPVS
jgi:predicted ATPase/DNA-binding CsgD family transcriptional regulator